MTWRTTTVRGTRVRWLDLGEGDPLLFLHGWGLTPRSYAPSVTPLTRAGIRVIAPRLRARTLDEYADQVAAFLGEIGVVHPVFVMGHSLGGGIAIRLAVRHPDLVRSLTLLNTVGGGPSGRTGMSHALPWWRWALGAVAEANPKTIVESGVGATLGVAANVVRDVVPGLLRHPVDSALTAYTALTADLVEDTKALEASGMPVLFVWGDRDRLVTPGAFAEIETAMSPEVVRGRHGWLLTAPHEFAALLHNALVVHAMLERSRRGQRFTGPFRDEELIPHERRRAARYSPGAESQANS